MWYRIDFIKLAMQLLPPILRSRFLMSLICVMIIPLRYVYNRFRTLKDSVDNRLNITGNVQYLEKALNDAFFLGDRQIYIETAEEEKGSVFHFEKERQKAKYFYMAGMGAGVTMQNKDESILQLNFIVKVPTFLCTHLDKSEDKYNGKNLAVIKKILDIYKPAGRTFGIELYDYE